MIAACCYIMFMTEEEEGGEPPATMHVTMTILLQFSSKTTVTKHPRPLALAESPEERPVLWVPLLHACFGGAKTQSLFFFLQASSPCCYAGYGVNRSSSVPLGLGVITTEFQFDT